MSQEERRRFVEATGEISHTARPSAGAGFPGAQGSTGLPFCINSLQTVRTSGRRRFRFPALRSRFTAPSAARDLLPLRLLLQLLLFLHGHGFGRRVAVGERLHLLAELAEAPL